MEYNCAERHQLIERLRYSRQYRQKIYIYFLKASTSKIFKNIPSSEPHPSIYGISKTSGEILVSFLFDLSMS